MVTGLWLEKITELRQQHLVETLLQAQDILPVELDADDFDFLEDSDLPADPNLPDDPDFLLRLWIGF